MEACPCAKLSRNERNTVSGVETPSILLRLLANQMLVMLVMLVMLIGVCRIESQAYVQTFEATQP